MKNTFKNNILLLAVILITGCFRSDIRTATFEIEQLRSLEAAQILAQSMRINGIREFRPDLENKTLTIVFNGLELYLKNIEYAIVKAGFDLPNWPADPADKAKLPEELR